MFTMRLARPSDAPAICAVYAPVVIETAISFESTPPTPPEMERRIRATLPARPWIVAERDGLLGYAYAGPHRVRTAYQWSVEPSVYIAKDARGKGVGRALYTALFKILIAQGFANAYAGVALPNSASLHLHQSFGFEEVGVYRRVGFKDGNWHDVWWGALDLSPNRTPTPAPPRSITDVENIELLLTAASSG